MNAPDSPDIIEQEALAWAVRFPLDAGQERELEAWLGDDRRRRGALTRALAAWSLLDRAHVARPAQEPELPEAWPEAWNDDNEEPAPSARARFDRRLVIGALGGGLAATVAGIVLPGLPWRQMETTRVGEVRRLPLKDGSLATINTDSAIKVALAKDIRKIDLVHGEAWFDVAKDPARPFVVSAGTVNVRAVGTAFSVRRIGETAVVSVTEGVVSAWSGERADGAVMIKAGEQARIGETGLMGVVDTVPERIERALAWREGEISLRGDTLADAVEEFNRYNSRQIIVTDPGLRQERLVGLFQTNAPEHFAQIVALTYDLQMTENEDTIVLLKK